MAGKTLTTNSQLICPHGGTVILNTTNVRVKVDGAYALLQTDVFSIAGCPFTIPAGPATIPSPCISIQWVLADMSVKVGGIPTLSESSVGLCFGATGLPQGTVTIIPTQVRVDSR